jgi:AbrB family looped-hinge helix DNA binding protein
LSVTGRKLLRITRVGKYNRTTIPGEVRKLLDLREGDEVAWLFEDGKIVIEKHVKGGDREQ